MKLQMVNLIFLVALVPATVHAEVVASDKHGFIIHHSVPLDVDADRAYEAITAEVSKWWIADHTWSGDSANLSMDARPGGCFCEALADGGSMQHMQITWIQPGKEIRMTGGLGPLQMMGVHGGMQWLLNSAEEGSVLEYHYSVTGYYPDGLDALAPVVDSVQGQQLEALRAYLAKE
jgi:uncharacterized protein YndB with AHSA1/START domain